VKTANKSTRSWQRTKTRSAPDRSASATPPTRDDSFCPARTGGTAFFTRFFVGLALSLFLAGTAGCGLAGGPSFFEVTQAQVNTRGSRVQVLLRQNLALSREAQRAVENGVPLVLELRYELRAPERLTLLASGVQTFEISYLPMSERYQLTLPGEGNVKTYPRLRHVLRELSSVRLDIDAMTLAAGDYQFRARMRLDRTSLPAPMQLPSLVYRGWRHDSEWTQWPFRINA
jgi:hypothetical protein